MPRLPLGIGLAVAGAALVFVAGGGTPVLAMVAGLLVATVILLWPLAGLVVTVVTNVLSPLIGGLAVSGVGVTLPRVLGGLTAASWLVWALTRRLRLTVAPQMIPLGFFLLAILFSVATVPDRGYSLLGLYTLLVSVLLYFLSANLAIDRRSIVAVTAGISAMATLSSVIGLVQYLVPSLAVVDSGQTKLDFGEGAIVDLDSVASGPIRRVTGGMGEPLFLAYMLDMVMPLSVFWWLRARRPWHRAIVLGMAGLQGAALVLTYSRTGLLGLMVGIFCLIWLRVIPLRWLVLAAIPIVVSAPLWMPQGFAERMFSRQYLKEGSTPIRRDIVTNAWRMFTERPLTGYGYGQFGPEFVSRVDTEWVRVLAREAPMEEIHNLGPHILYAEVAIEYGLLGLVPYLIFLAWVVRDLMQARRAAPILESELAACLVAGILSFYICGFLGQGKAMKIFWVECGLALGLRRAVLGPPALLQSQNNAREPGVG